MREAPSRCIVCGDLAVPSLQRGKTSWVRSPGCGLEWQRSFPDEDELAALYGEGYLERWGAADADALARVREMKYATHRAFLDEVARHRAAGRLLDVGCAMGFLLDVARERGFEAWGIDPNPGAVRAARERFGDRVVCARLDGDVLPGVRFDVVTLIDVLEHVPDPESLLHAIRSRLAPGGVLAAVLPNRASLVRLVLGARWPHYVREHLVQWSPANLSRFLADRGWRVCELRTGVRKTFSGRYLSAYAACVGSWLPPGVAWLGDRTVRVPTGEMLVVATPEVAGDRAAG